MMQCDFFATVWPAIICQVLSISYMHGQVTCCRGTKGVESGQTTEHYSITISKLIANIGGCQNRRGLVVNFSHKKAPAEN